MVKFEQLKNFTETMSSHDFAMLQLKKTCQVLCYDVTLLDEKRSKFTEITPRSLQKLTTILRTKMDEYAHSTRMLMEHAGRTQPSFMDVERMLRMKKESLKDIMVYAKVRAPKGRREKLPEFPVPKKNVIGDPPARRKKSKKAKAKPKPKPKPKPLAIRNPYPGPSIPIFTDPIDYESTDFGFSKDSDDDSDSDDSDSDELEDFGDLQEIQNLEVSSDSRRQNEASNTWSLERFLPSEYPQEDSGDLDQFFTDMFPTTETLNSGVPDSEVCLEASGQQERTPEKGKSSDEEFEEIENPEVPVLKNSVGSDVQNPENSEDVKNLNPEHITGESDSGNHLKFETLLEDLGHQDVTDMTFQDVMGSGSKNLTSSSEMWISEVLTSEGQLGEDFDALFQEDSTPMTLEEFSEFSAPEVSSQKDLETHQEGTSEFSTSEAPISENSDASPGGYRHRKDMVLTSEDVRNLKTTSSQISTSEGQSHQDFDVPPDVTLMTSEDVENPDASNPERESRESKKARKSRKESSRKRKIEDFDVSGIENGDLKRVRLQETLENSDPTPTEALLEDSGQQEVLKMTSEDVRDSRREVEILTSIGISENQTADGVREETQRESHDPRKAKKDQKRGEELREDLTPSEIHEDREGDSKTHLQQNPGYRNRTTLASEDLKNLKSTSSKTLASEVQILKDSESRLEESRRHNLITMTSEEVKILETISENMVSCEISTFEVPCHEDSEAQGDHRNSERPEKKAKKSKRKSSGQKSGHHDVTATEDVKNLKPKSEIRNPDVPSIEKELNESRKSRKSKKKDSRKRRTEGSSDSKDQEDSRIWKKAKLQKTPKSFDPKPVKILETTSSAILTSRGNQGSIFPELQDVTITNSEDMKNLESTSSENLPSEVQSRKDSESRLGEESRPQELITMTLEELMILERISKNMTSCEISTSEVMCQEDSSEGIANLVTSRESTKSTKSKKSKMDSSRTRNKKEDSADSKIESSKSMRLQETTEKPDPTPAEPPRLRLTLKISRELLAKSAVIPMKNQNSQNLENPEDVPGKVDAKDQIHSETTLGGFEHQNVKIETSEDLVDSGARRRHKRRKYEKYTSSTSEVQSRLDSKTLPEEEVMSVTSEDVVDPGVRRRQKHKKSKYSKPSTSEVSRHDSEHQNEQMLTPEDVRDSEKKCKSLDSEDPKAEESKESKSSAKKPKKNKRKRGRCPYLM